MFCCVSFFLISSITIFFFGLGIIFLFIPQNNIQYSLPLRLMNPQLLFLLFPEPLLSLLFLLGFPCSIGIFEGLSLEIEAMSMIIVFPAAEHAILEFEPVIRMELDEEHAARKYIRMLHEEVPHGILVAFYIRSVYELFDLHSFRLPARLSGASGHHFIIHYPLPHCGRTKRARPSKRSLGSSPPTRTPPPSK